MVKTRWNKMFLLLMLVLQFGGALNRQLYLLHIVREGDEVTLSCENVVGNHHNCDTTTWMFGQTAQHTVELVDLGQFNSKINVDRLSLTTNCSLVIKKVTVEDAGRYACRQYISGIQQGSDALVDLSVVTVTEHNNTDEVTLKCSVRKYGERGHTMKWLLKGQDIDKDNPNIKTSQFPDSATVSFLINFWISSTPYYNVLKCSVSTEDPKKSVTFGLRRSGEDTKPTTTTITTKITTTASSLKGDTTTTESSFNDPPKLSNLWWLFIVVPVVVVALLIIAVKLIRSRRTKGKNIQRNDNVALTSEPAVAQSATETSQDMADPEDGVSYASISYTRTANGKAKIRSKKDDDDTVTYSTVKASSPDPSSLYATINNPKSGP